eukprot:5508248-Pyramimonas_sp.AAC.1
MDLGVSMVHHVKAHGSKAKTAQFQFDELKIATGNGAMNLLTKEGAALDANYGKQQALDELGTK